MQREDGRSVCCTSMGCLAGKVIKAIGVPVSRCVFAISIQALQHARVFRGDERLDQGRTRSKVNALNVVK